MRCELRRSAQQVDRHIVDSLVCFRETTAGTIFLPATQGSKCERLPREMPTGVWGFRRLEETRRLSESAKSFQRNVALHVRYAYISCDVLPVRHHADGDKRGYHTPDDLELFHLTPPALRPAKTAPWCNVASASDQFSPALLRQEQRLHDRRSSSCRPSREGPFRPRRT